jgi:hypothetical protein
MRGWNESDVEILLAWLEENRELIRGSTKVWTSRVKEAVFDDNPDIDAKKIKSKYHNMKSAWQAAKKLQEQSGLLHQVYQW